MKLQNLIHIVMGILCIGLLPRTQAVVPPPDGGYPGFTTAEGTNALQSLTTGSANTAVGWFSLFSDTEGSFNTATGAGALLFNTADQNTAFGAAALLFNTLGVNNTAVGAAALLNNTGGSANSQKPSGFPLGSFNTAIGNGALSNNTTGSGNTANGALALSSNIEGEVNTATGVRALFLNTTGFGNTATGANALFGNTEGDFNTATGTFALFSNTTGIHNTAVGSDALRHNDQGIDNTAIGFGALSANTLGEANTATGAGALSSNTGNFNTATGRDALSNNTFGDSNTAVGESALFHIIDGVNNTALGTLAGFDATGSNSVYIGANVNGVAGESNTIRIADNLPTGTGQSACFIGGIRSQLAPAGVAVLVDAAGKLGTIVSSKRFKEEIKPMDKASEALFALTPVTFRYKKEFDPAGTSQLGLVAEDVEKVNPDLVVRDKEGKPYTVRYDAVNAMLLNEFLKEHRTVQEQGATITQLKSMVEKQEAANAQQQKQIEALTTGLQKVSTQLEASKPAPQVVNNP